MLKYFFSYRISENAFGITANRWRCMLTTMQQHPNTVSIVVQACATLHNRHRMMYPELREDDREDRHGNVRDGEWRAGIRQQERLLDSNNRGNNARPTQDARAQREYLRNYYMRPAHALPWQDQIVQPPRAVTPDPASSSDESDVD